MAFGFLHQQARQKGIRYSLDLFEAFLAKIGSPQNKLPTIVHIAGTNGKGSTLTYVQSALIECGVCVGHYTSPHFLSYTERMGINAQPISVSDFEQLLAELAQQPNFDSLTEFEVLTAMAFLYFSRCQPDVLLLEVGLGGRLDATNVVNSTLSVITKIGMDHRVILGDTLEKIATEKAGIIKPAIPVLSLCSQAPEVRAVFERVAYEKNAPLQWVMPLAELPKEHRMQGQYQKENLALAQAIVTRLGYGQDPRAQIGFQKAIIWGRYMPFVVEGKEVLIDAAHNQDGAVQLCSQLGSEYHAPIIFIVGIYKQKHFQDVMHPILEYAQTFGGEIWICEFDPEMSWTVSDIQSSFPNYLLKKFPEASLPGLPIDIKKSSQKVVITGSIYFISRFLQSEL